MDYTASQLRRRIDVSERGTIRESIGDTVSPTATSDTDHSELTIAQTIAHIASDLADMGSLSKKALDFLQTKGSSSNDDAVGNFLNKRLDGIALMRSEKRVVPLEFTRAMDTNEDFQSITEKRKTARYALHCEFIASLLNSSFRMCTTRRRMT